MKELQYLNKYFFKYKYRFLLGIIITIVAQIFSLFTPVYIGKSITIIEKFLQNKNSDIDILRTTLIQNIGIILGVTIIAGFFTFLMRQTLIVMSRHIEFDLKNEIFQHYQSLSTNFYKLNRTGDLMNRITEDVSKVRMYVGPAVMYTINTIIRFVAIIISMSTISVKLTLYSLAPLPLLSFCIFLLSKEINKRSTKYQENLSHLSSFTQEFFSGIRIIKSFAIEQNRKDVFSNYSHESKTRNLKLAFTNALFGPLMIFLIGISYLIVVLVGGQMYINKEISDLGTIAQFLLYIGMLVWPVASFGWVSSLVQEAEASQKRLNEFLKTESEIENNGYLKHNFKGTITFNNVSLYYPDTKIKALDHISFHVEEGETLVILGKTGSGKSSLISLIPRLYNPSTGDILINNTPLQNYDLQYLRENISIVPQDNILFSDTIKNNIAFGNDKADFSQIIEVAQKANIHHNIETFTEGYNTIIGERGIMLSGGQKQRLSIARALLKNAKIYLFDDCLSAVDTETEEKIIQNITQKEAKTTKIIITHRANIGKIADKIIYLENGKIIEEGTPNQLIKNKGNYYELLEQQLHEKEN